MSLGLANVAARQSDQTQKAPCRDEGGVAGHGASKITLCPSQWIIDLVVRQLVDLPIARGTTELERGRVHRVACQCAVRVFYRSTECRAFAQLAVVVARELQRNPASIDDRSEPATVGVFGRRKHGIGSIQLLERSVELRGIRQRGE